jgi:predicted nucleic acid-binding protein
VSVLFLDASALTKAYVEEAGDASIRGMVQRARGDLFLSRFVALEVLTSIRNIHRGSPRDRYVAAMQRFWTDYRSRFSVVEVDDDVVSDAIALTTARREGRARSLDVLHLATALRLQASSGVEEVTMVTSDVDLAAMSKQCGLRTFDPSREPLAALPARRR